MTALVNQSENTSARYYADRPSDWDTFQLRLAASTSANNARPHLEASRVAVPVEPSSSHRFPSSLAEQCRAACRGPSPPTVCPGGGSHPRHTARRIVCHTKKGLAAYLVSLSGESYNRFRTCSARLAPSARPRVLGLNQPITRPKSWGARAPVN